MFQCFQLLSIATSRISIYRYFHTTAIIITQNMKILQQTVLVCFFFQFTAIKIIFLDYDSEDIELISFLIKVTLAIVQRIQTSPFCLKRVCILFTFYEVFST